MESGEVGSRLAIERRDLDRLFEALHDRGYRTVGPVSRDGAIVYDEISSSAELPAGWTDEQAPGHYRLKRRDDAALFGFNAPASAWKQFLFPPQLTLWEAVRNGPRLEFLPRPAAGPRFAFLGVRGCEIAALAIHDRVLRDGPCHDAVYAERRAQAFVVAVPCAQAGGTCFCASMGTGPGVESGFDLKLTESTHGGTHRFLIEAGSERGREVLAALPTHPATAAEVEAARRTLERVAAGMGRSLDTAGLAETLAASAEHPRWADVAQRCLACGNCTMACPTCFCHTVEDVSDLTGTRAGRVRRWDSCFSLDFSYIHGGSVRPGIRSRYRQWLTHKLSSWHSQFGTSGCVGCGRCITWCPARIDITEEARALQSGARPQEAAHANP
jgi:ferredoxin